jgi:hypothetical protein
MQQIAAPEKDVVSDRRPGKRFIALQNFEFKNVRCPKMSQIVAPEKDVVGSELEMSV